MDPIDTFSISHSHLAFAVKSPHLNQATHTRQDVYLMRLDSGELKQITPHPHGAISSLVFSPDGSKLAWLEMAKDGHESDKRVVVTYEEGRTTRWTDDWDLSPSSITVSRGRRRD